MTPYELSRRLEGLPRDGARQARLPAPESPPADDLRPQGRPPGAPVQSAKKLAPSGRGPVV